MKALIFSSQDYNPLIFGKPLGFFVADAAREAGVEDISPSGAFDEIINYKEVLLIISSAVPLISPETINETVKRHKDGPGGVTALTSGGVPLVAVMDPQAISATAEETSVAEWVAAAENNGVDTRKIPLDDELFVVDNPLKLDQALRIIRTRVNTRHMENGVTLLGSDSIWISPDVQIGRGSLIYQGTILEPGTVIGENCVIGPNSQISSSRVGNGSTVINSVIQDSEIGRETNVGPFAYLRPHSKIGDFCKIGDFVEVKNSVVGNHTKASHLTYLGDCDVGEFVNFGCGTVVVNYSGKKKSRSVIKDGAFIGCNTNLISPVTINEKAYTAAGSTITRDVPEKALGLARARQINKEGWNE